MTPASQPPIDPNADAAALDSVDQAHAADSALEAEQVLNLEALLFASEKPLTNQELRVALGVDAKTLTRLLELLSEKLTNHAVELIRHAAGYRLRVRPQHAALIQSTWPDRAQKLSPALLETLSIVAYKQPVTRADIEQLRGVSTSSGVLRQLFDRGWITERGTRDAPGKPALLHTTKCFLDAFGLQSLAQLPELPQLELNPSLAS